jgi:twitching motility protein PilI
MTRVAGNDLHALREHPFEVLRELERRSRTALAGGADDDTGVEEWQGIGIRIGAERFVVPRNEVREVLMLPATITRVPGAKPWMRGLANVRGHLLPIVDLRTYLGSGPAAAERTYRVIVLNNTEYSIGLIVDEVYGFRRFLEREHTTDFAQPTMRSDRYLQGAFRRGLEVWPVLQLAKLLESRDFQRAAED